MFSKIILFLCFGILSAVEFSADDYPNPKTIKGSKECNMRSISNVCDPDQVLNEGTRYRFNHELQKMIRRTEKINGNFCDKKGFEPLLLIAHEGDQELADELNQRWNLDGKCRKSVIFFLSALDHALYYSSEPETGFDQSDFLAIKAGQETYLAEGNFTFALINIFKQIGGAKNIQVTSDDEVTNYKLKIHEENSSSKISIIFSFFVIFLTKFLV